MDVTISLRSVQRMDGDTETTAMTARGTLEQLPDGARLCYTESPQDGGAAVTVSVRDGQTVIERRGEISSQIVLEEGRRHSCRYETPYGQLTLYAQARQLVFSNEGNTAFLRAVYLLEMSGAYTEQEIEFRIKEVSPC